MQFISNLNISRLIPKSRYFNPLLKVLVFLVLGYHIGKIVIAKDLFSVAYVSRIADIGFGAKLAVLFVILLFPVNWALETLKWRFLIKGTEKVSFFQAYKGILTGVAFGFATPHGIGDYAGRILQLESAERSSLIGAVFVSRIAQFFITFLFGSAALVFFFSKFYSDWLIFNTLSATLLMANGMFLLMFVLHRQALYSLKKIVWLKGIYRYFSIIGQYSVKEMFSVLSFSCLRYMVFTIQFVILLLVFDVHSNYLILFTGVSFIFFVKSVMPTLFDLGVRESAALYFFSYFQSVEEGVLVASLSLWAINILLPAIIGMFMSLKIKISGKE
ncbi:lysylphosphatidylglycerol synthase transmembrane domain-containing protein [Cytophagaceae bacterium ABcell3]|nr:lysylphosphatidylglycerol synthase transmembrane domain-containing protein [Cytophagaceae bacterium ABcell3]